MSVLQFISYLCACFLGGLLGDWTIRYARKRRGERKLAEIIYAALDGGTVDGKNIVKAEIKFILTRDGASPAAGTTEGEGETR